MRNEGILMIFNTDNQKYSDSAKDFFIKLSPFYHISQIIVPFPLVKYHFGNTPFAKVIYTQKDIPDSLCRKVASVSVLSTQLYQFRKKAQKNAPAKHFCPLGHHLHALICYVHIKLG